MAQVFVQTFTHLKDRPRADHALPMLQRIASLVKPIMRKHDWILPVLAEFCPDNPSLLGLSAQSLSNTSYNELIIVKDVNKGQKICLRLRPGHAPDTFYDEEDIVQTMLHELAHNVHGPHDEKFYKFLSGLQDEYDALQRNGYAGEGFFSKGQRLGANVSHNLTPHQARLKAVEAAEKRKQTSRVLGRGGRLGGRLLTKGLSLRELAAQAAERRVNDEKACASGALANQEAAKAAKESIEDHVIDLTVDDSDPEEVIVLNRPPASAGPSKVVDNSKRTHCATSTKLNARSPTSSSISSNLVPKLETFSKLSSSEWACPACTLLNDAMTLQCDACMAVRPPNLSSGWSCLSCGTVDVPHERWMCPSCGKIKTRS